MSSNNDVLVWDGTCNDCPYNSLDCDITGRCFMEENLESGDAIKESEVDDE